MNYKEGDTVYLKRDKAVISQLYKSTTGEEGYIVIKNYDNDHLYFAKEDELEIIEAECKHEWKKYSLGRLGGITGNHKFCVKCGIDEIEPDHFTDVGKMANNTYKIEELDTDSFYDEIKGYETLDCESAVLGITDKLNEVINKVNAQTEVLLAQEKEIEEIKEQLNY